MLYNNSTIKAVLSKNDTDLIITMQSYNRNIRRTK